MGRLNQTTRRARRRVHRLKQLGVWLFLASFIASIIGLAFVTQSSHQ